MSEPEVPEEMWGTPLRRQVFVNDRTTEAFILALEKRMRPGGFSEIGFLGPTERLLDRLHADDAWLDRHHITHEQIADRLETIIVDAECALRITTVTRVVVDGFEIEAQYSCGFQECPFSLTDLRTLTLLDDRSLHWCGYEANNFTISDRTTNRSVFVPKLAIHLIRDHHFFEGETPFRVDPETVAALLQIEPRP